MCVVCVYMLFLTGIERSSNGVKNEIRQGEITNLLSQNGQGY